MDAVITRAPGTEKNGLADWLEQALRGGIAADQTDGFQALRAAVMVVAPDKRESVTLRFDHGHVTMHDGMVGVPDVTFCGDWSVLTALAALPLARVGPLVVPRFWRAGMAYWRGSLSELLTGDLKVYGLMSHPRVVTRVVRLLAST